MYVYIFIHINSVCVCLSLMLTFDLPVPSEDLFRDMADRLAEDGWKELGYEYVIIDDCWMSMLRDEHGRLQPDPSRLNNFPCLSLVPSDWKPTCQWKLSKVSKRFYEHT